MHDPSSILSFHSISYKKERDFLFKNITCSLHKGDILFIEGSNGSGKTTLIKILLGLIPFSIGKIFYKNNLLQKVLKDFYEELVYIGHDNALINELTLLENIQFFYAITGKSITPTSSHNFLKILQDFHLINYQNSKISSLSQGQKKRLILLKLALFHKKIWILDEPFDSLDSHGREMILQLFKQHAQLGGIIIFTSHIKMPWMDMDMLKLIL